MRGRLPGRSAALDLPPLGNGRVITFDDPCLGASEDWLLVDLLPSPHPWEATLTWLRGGASAKAQVSATNGQSLSLWARSLEVDALNRAARSNRVEVRIQRIRAAVQGPTPVFTQVVTWPEEADAVVEVPPFAKTVQVFAGPEPAYVELAWTLEEGRFPVARLPLVRGQTEPAPLGLANRVVLPALEARPGFARLLFTLELL